MQVLDTKGLKLEKTEKIDQWGELKRELQEVIPIKNSKIDTYRIFWGDIVGFEEGGVKEEFVEWIISNV